MDLVRVFDLCIFLPCSNIRKWTRCISAYEGTYVIIQNDEFFKRQYGLQSGVFVDCPLLEIFKSFEDLPLDVDKIEVISGGEEVEVCMVGDIPENHSFIELWPDQLLHFEV